MTPLRLPRQGGRPGPLLAGTRPAPRNGRTPATARRRSSSTSRCRTSARRPRGGAGSSRRASRTGAPASQWTVEDRPGYVSAFDPRTGEERWRWTQRHLHVLVAAGHGRRPRVRRGADRRVQRAATPAAVTCCGSSSAAAATTAARRPTASTASSTSSCRAAGAAGPRGSCPRCSGPPTGARCSPSRCRTRQRKSGRRSATSARAWQIAD